MLFMLQKEVADRLGAKPDSDDYGRLSVMVQYFCKVTVLFDVAPSAFYPPPKVKSSILKIIPYTTLPFVAEDEAKFAAVVKQAFSQRRKTLRNTLKSMVNEEQWAAIGINPGLRAEVLSVEDFVKIANVLSKE